MIYEVFSLFFLRAGIHQGNESRHGMRKQELSEEVVAILHTRIHLSRSGVFPMRKIWEGWGMSKRTLYRYKNPSDRELSREIARKHNLLRQGPSTECEKCELPLKGHRRCLNCTILLHTGTLPCRCGERHGDTVDGLLCNPCIDTLAKGILSPYEELYGDN